MCVCVLAWRLDSLYIENRYARRECINNVYVHGLCGDVELSLPPDSYNFPWNCCTVFSCNGHCTHGRTTRQPWAGRIQRCDRAIPWARVSPPRPSQDCTKANAVSLRCSHCAPDSETSCTFRLARLPSGLYFSYKCDGCSSEIASRLANFRTPANTATPSLHGHGHLHDHWPLPRCEWEGRFVRLVPASVPVLAHLSSACDWEWDDSSDQLERHVEHADEGKEHTFWVVATRHGPLTSVGGVTFTTDPEDPFVMAVAERDVRAAAPPSSSRASHDTATSTARTTQDPPTPPLAEHDLLKLRAENHRLKIQNVTLHNANTRLEDDNASLSTQVEALQRELDTLAAEQEMAAEEFRHILESM